MDWQGSWVTGTVYLEDDVVEFEGSAYIAIMDTTGTESPENSAYWGLLVRASTSSRDFAFQGFSHDSVSGNSGFASVNDICETEFGAGARIATASEVLSATDLSSGSGQAWVYVEPAGSASLGKYIAHGSQNCDGFASNYWGVSVDKRDLQFAAESCTSTLPVACSALESEKTYFFRGFSSSKEFGHYGPLSMNDACAETFGADARMATSEEIAGSKVLVTQTGGDAWVRPVRSSTDSDKEEFSGLRFNNCSDWSYLNTTGLTVNGSTFDFSVTGTCGVSRVVACSAP